MILKKTLFIALTLIMAAAAARGQGSASKGSSGTVYSKIGFGQPADLSTSTAAGMGLFGVSFIEPQVPSISNPAQWGKTEYGIASGGFDLRSTRASDRSANTSNTLLSANHFQIQLPLLQRKLGFSAAFYPSTRSNYRLLQEGTQRVGSGSTADTLNFVSESRGSGGVSNIEMGIGWSISDRFAVGYAAKLVFASVDDNYTTTFDEDPYLGVDFTLQTSGTAMGHRFGTYLDMPGLFREEDRLSAGLAVDLPVTIEARRQADDGTLLTGTLRRETGALGDGTVKLPMTLTGGVSYRPNPVIAFSGEALFQNWSDARYPYSSNAGKMYSDRFKIGAGLRYHPFETGSTTFLSYFKYRLGLSYDSGHLNIQGRDIETLKISGGMGISSGNSGSTIDLGFYYGLRGTESQNLVKEHIWGLRLSLNLAELMFVPERLE